jgi:hypothetical protein
LQGTPRFYSLFGSALRAALDGGVKQQEINNRMVANAQKNFGKWPTKGQVVSIFEIPKGAVLSFSNTLANISKDVARGLAEAGSTIFGIAKLSLVLYGMAGLVGVVLMMKARGGSSEPRRQ